MVAGHWMPDVVDAAGGRYGMVDPGETARPREFAEVREYDPAVAIAAPCGFGLDQTARDLDALTANDGWETLSAVEAGRTWALDGHHYANRPGPRIVDTVEHVAAMLWPDAFDAPPREAARPLAELRAEA
jgi:iron complex transport system substrate-binding protein